MDIMYVHVMCMHVYMYDVWVCVLVVCICRYVPVVCACDPLRSDSKYLFLNGQWMLAIGTGALRVSANYIVHVHVHKF